MTVAPTTLDQRTRGAPGGWGRLPSAPAEGWSSVALLALMAALVGLAIDDAHWVLGSQTLTSFLPWAGMLGVLWGVFAAKAGRGRLLAHLGGAVVATMYLTLVVGAELAPGASIGRLFQVTSDSVAGAYVDLVVRGNSTTRETGHFLLILGIVCWGAGQFAGFTAFGHRRPVAAVVLPGAILLANVALTIRDQYELLVVFSLAALLFLVRFHVADEQQAWVRHRIGDVGDAAGLSLRVGLTFVATAVIGALLLTRSASSAPLANAWPGLTDTFIQLAQPLVRYLPAGGPGTRITGTQFASSVTVTGEWVTDATAVLTIQTPAGSPRMKWRAVAYDRLVGNTWSWSRTAEVSVGASDGLLAGTSDGPLDSVGYVTADYQVSGSAAGSIVVAPGIPARIDRNARVTLVQGGDETAFARIAPATGGGYALRALLPDLSNPNDPRALTANRLRAAGTTYPAGLLATYTAIEPGTVGPATRALLSQILDRAQPATPYDSARAIEAFLRDGRNFTYTTDVSDVACGGRGVVECFVVSRRGYCEHYASAMTVMLRMEGIPARFVEGFLPGVRDGSGRETILRNQAHAWVEAWFPGAGWIDFDPTGGGVGLPVALPAGPAVVTPGPAASTGPNGNPGPTRRIGVDEPGGSTGGRSTPGRGPGIGTLIVVLVPLSVALLGLIFLVAWRRFGRPAEPVAVYRTVARLAGRLGYPRRPTQTVYEYLGALSDVVPAVRPELQLVARSTVEAAYGRRRFGADRLSALGGAQRRLRIALLRLALVRRRGRPAPDGAAPGTRRRE
jgi:transglutaminase-like putative cysteine protease